ncbi:heavy metal sensor histidine kinase [Bordetella sp. 2513F-2]
MNSRLSLTARLTALFGLSSALVLLGLALLIREAIDRHFAEQDYAQLADSLQQVRQALRAGQPETLPERLAALDGHPQRLQVYVRVGESVAYATPEVDFGTALVATSRATAGSGALQWEQDGHVYRGIWTQMPDRPPATLLVAMDTGVHAHFLQGFQRSLAFYVALAALACGLLGWWSSRRGLAPLRAMAARAEAVTSQRVYERMPAEAVPVEMADLAVNLNAMLERLQQDFNRLSAFSSDLAHELRTPLASLLAQTQAVLSQEHDAAAYRDALAANAQALQRLARMVADMLYLAKMEHGLELSGTETIQVAEEVQGLFEFYEPLADDKQVRLRRHGDARITGDRLMLRRALGNLLSNALRHTPPQGTILVEVHADTTQVSIAVENEGDDIPAEIQPMLFERFSRAGRGPAWPDPGSENTGLGLAITRAIMAAHGGRVDVHSAGGRTRFTLYFPVRASL